MRPWAAAGFLLAAAAGAGFLGRWEWRRASPRRTDGELVALLTAQRPEMAELLLTGADLAGWGDEGVSRRRASEGLVRAQVERASSASAGLDPAGALPWKPLAAWAARASAAGVVLVFALAFAPTGFGAYTRLLTGGPPDPVAVGNLRVTYQPPAYTGLPERRVEGSDGAVEGYPGTRVTLEGEVSDAVDAGRWRGPSGSEVALSVDGRRFSVSWTLAAAGSYELAFERGGRPVPSGLPPRPVTLLEDRRPAVEMDDPAEDMEITTDQELEVTFRAADDFRVERVELVLQGDEEVRIPVGVAPEGTLQGRARFLPLAHPKLGAGAHLRVEAWDGDSANGPKAGSSRSVYLTFLDKRRLVADIADLEARLLEALLGQLADHLELAEPPAPEDLERLRAKGRDLLRLFDQLLERVRQGADEEALGAAAALKIEAGLRAALEPFLEGGTDRVLLIAELERDILFLDRMLQSLRMEEALSLGDELAALQRSLFDDLEAGASPEQLLERVDQLQRLLAQMAEKLSRGASEMPDAFANADAVKDMPASELQQTLEELRKALAEGDRERAQELSEKLVEMLSRWLSALEEAAGKASRDELDPMLEEISKLETDVRDIAAEQEKLLEETGALGREVSERAAPELRQAMESLAEREERRLQRIEEASRRMEAAVPRGGFHGLPPQVAGTQPPSPAGGLEILEARQRVGAASSEVRQGLQGDLGRARQGAEALEQAVETLRERVLQALGEEEARRGLVEGEAQVAREEVRGLLADLEGLSQGRRSGMTPQEGEALQGMGGRQGGLAERTGAVAERLEGLAGRNPLLNRQLPQRARSAQQAMGQAGDRLGQGDPFGAVPPETRALEDLAEVSRQLQDAQRQMSEGQGQGQGQGLQMVRRPGQRPGQGRDVDRSPVEIPQESEARELRAFREEVLRAMRSGRYPKDYEEEVERYYERLIR